MNKTPITLAGGRVDLFVWGKVIKVHTIGDLTIVEYENSFDNQVLFHAYYGDLDTHESFGTLDIAIVGALGYKYDGRNSQACRYFVRMIGM